MNSETMAMVDPDVLKAVKTVVDENVPTGQVAVQMTDGSVKHIPVRQWETRMKSELAKQAELERQEAVAAKRRRSAHKRERQNKRKGRR